LAVTAENAWVVDVPDTAEEAANLAPEN